jgi:hypothetical protein
LCITPKLEVWRTKWGFTKHDVYPKKKLVIIRFFLALNESGVKYEHFLGIGIENNIM